MATAIGGSSAGLAIHGAAALGVCPTSAAAAAVAGLCRNPAPLHSAPCPLTGPCTPERLAAQASCPSLPPPPLPLSLTPAAANQDQAQQKPPHTACVQGCKGCQPASCPPATRQPHSSSTLGHIATNAAPLVATPRGGRV